MTWRLPNPVGEENFVWDAASSLANKIMRNPEILDDLDGGVKKCSLPKKIKTEHQTIRLKYESIKGMKFIGEYYPPQNFKRPFIVFHKENLYSKIGVDLFLHELLHAIWFELGYGIKTNSFDASKTIGDALTRLFENNALVGGSIRTLLEYKTVNFRGKKIPMHPEDK